MFLSTQEPNHIYKYLVNSSKLHAEKISKKKFNILFFEMKKKISLKFLLYILYILVSGKFFKSSRVYLEYEGVNIGRNINSSSFRNYKSYTSKFSLYLELIKNFYRAGTIIETCKDYIKKGNIKALYVDHCTYLNGIIYSYFSKARIPIYTNNYPLSIFMIDFRNKKNLPLSKYEDVIKFSYKKKINKKQKIEAEEILKKITFQKNYLSWMKKIQFKNLKKINYRDFDYVIYAHSFTDGVLVYGNDGFANTLDWLDFTLSELKKNKKKVLIKAHPNFYEKSYGILNTWDQKIFKKIIDKYSSDKNFYFLNTPIFNYDLLKQLNRNCTLITHHGTVLLEGAYLNFKTICSESTFYYKNYKHTATWKGKAEYKILLNKNLIRPSKVNKDDLYELIYNMYFSNFSYYSKNSWEKIIAKEINISPEEFTDRVTIFSGVKESNQKQKIKYLENKIKKRLKVILNKLSLNILQISMENKKIKYSIQK